MAGEIRSHQVSDLIAAGKLEIGDGYRAKNSELSPTGLPFARAGNINDGFHFEDADRFPLEALARVGNKVSRPGDVVFTSKGTVGRFALVRETTPKFVYSPQLCFWRSLDRDSIWPSFLYYWMNSREFYAQYKAVAGQTDMADYVSLTDQRRMQLSFPDLPVQKTIAHILGTLDDKIDLNRRTNETLEAMARALFKSWFVEQLSSDALAEASAQALAEENVLHIGDGYRAKNSELGQPGLPFARAGNIKNGFAFEGADHLRESSVGLAGDKISRAFDVVFTSKGTVGRFAFVDPLMEPFVYSPQLCYWRSLDHRRLNPLVLYQWMLSRWFLSQVDRVKGQTDMAEYVSLRDQRCMSVPLPPEISQHRIGEQLEPIRRRIWANTKESQTLSMLRDALLPKLLSGEVLVSESFAAKGAP